jgi:hypothetical protein
MRRSIAELETERAKLEARLKDIQDEGEVLVGVRLDRSAAGGTATKQDCKYARLRAGRGKLLPNGKQSQYVKLEDIPEVEAAIVRGAEVGQLRRRLEQLNRILA